MFKQLDVEQDKLKTVSDLIEEAFSFLQVAIISKNEKDTQKWLQIYNYLQEKQVAILGSIKAILRDIDLTGP